MVVLHGVCDRKIIQGNFNEHYKDYHDGVDGDEFKQLRFNFSLSVNC